MISKLQTLHEEITHHGAKLDIAINAPLPSLACVATTRWKLYSLARTRQEFVQGKILPCLKARSMKSEHAKLDGFEQDIELAGAELSRHVSAWSIARVQDDWEGYCVVATEMRKKMGQQIASDKLMLIPLLRTYASEAEIIMSA